MQSTLSFFYSHLEKLEPWFEQVIIPLLYVYTHIQLYWRQYLATPYSTIVRWLYPPETGDKITRHMFCHNTRSLQVTDGEHVSIKKNSEETPSSSSCILRHQKYNIAKEEHEPFDIILKPTEVSSLLNKPVVPILEPTPSNIEFMEVEITLHTRDGPTIPHSLEFKSKNKYNFYVSGNRICSRFMEYFLHTHYPHLLERVEMEYPMRYNLTIIDHETNIKELSEKDAITIHVDDYRIEKHEEVDDDNTVMEGDVDGTSSTL